MRSLRPRSTFRWQAGGQTTSESCRVVPMIESLEINANTLTNLLCTKLVWILTRLILWSLWKSTIRLRLYAPSNRASTWSEPWKTNKKTRYSSRDLKVWPTTVPISLTPMARFPTYETMIEIGPSFRSKTLSKAMQPVPQVLSARAKQVQTTLARNALVTVMQNNRQLPRQRQAGWPKANPSWIATVVQRAQ